MLQFTTVLSSLPDKLNRRIVKLLRFGKPQTTFEASPYGVDSNPIADMVAVYGETSEKGKQVIIGYINKNQIAQPGEIRIYSTDADGNVQSSTYHKNDGTIITSNANCSIDLNPNGEIDIQTQDFTSVISMIGNQISISSEGTIVFNGQSNNLVKYNQLASACSALANAINTENAKIAAAITSLGGVYTPGIISFNISSAKATKLYSDG